MSMQSEGELAVELLVRGELPPPALEQARSVEEELEALKTGGVVDTVQRQSWDKRVEVSECATPVRDRYLAFTEWAQNEGVSLRPFFQTRERYSSNRAGLEDWLVLPAMTLAIYEGETLSAVYPHTDGEATRTVEDGLRTLRSDDPGQSEQAPSLLAD